MRFRGRKKLLSAESMNPKTAFETYLSEQNEEAWSAALATLLRSIHEVDRAATQIWFAFYPLSLFRALEATEDRAKLAHDLLLQGDYELKNQIDSSHHFLYGHRFWPQVKRAVEENAREGVEKATNTLGGVPETSVDSNSQHPAPDTRHPGSLKLADQILEVARCVAREIKKDESLLVGITAVAFMTLQQVGLEAFKAAPGTIVIDRKNTRKVSRTNSAGAGER
jgi:hypothetical protein